MLQFFLYLYVLYLIIFLFSFCVIKKIYIYISIWSREKDIRVTFYLASPESINPYKGCSSVLWWKLRVKAEERIKKTLAGNLWKGRGQDESTAQGEDSAHRKKNLSKLIDKHWLTHKKMNVLLSLQRWQPRLKEWPFVKFPKNKGVEWWCWWWGALGPTTIQVDPTVSTGWIHRVYKLSRKNPQNHKIN